MDDLISRQAAIDALGELPTFTQDWSYNTWMYTDDVYNAIKELPPIQPKKGRWIYCEDTTADCVDGYRCDQCGFFVPWDYKHKGIDYIQDYNFCPNCGAKMGVTE